jgi:hypothetical protein
MNNDTRSVVQCLQDAACVFGQEARRIKTAKGVYSDFVLCMRLRNTLRTPDGVKWCPRENRKLNLKQILKAWQSL